MVDLRYQVAFSNSIPVSPTSSGAFANGVWSGNVTVSQAATNVVLKADDSAGHTALSTPFNRHRGPAAPVAPSPGRRPIQLHRFQRARPALAILASSNSGELDHQATLTNTTGTTNFTDSTTGPAKRFYRAHQSP